MNKDKEKQIISRELYLDGRRIANFYYRKSDGSVEKYIRFFSEGYKRLAVFFNVQPSKINIYFVYSRREMDRHWGERSPDWLCAMVDRESVYDIYIFSPLVFEQLTTHKKEEIIPTIIHETAHTFVSEVNRKCFSWMNEGVCCYLETGRSGYKKVDLKNWKWFKDNGVLINPNIKWSEVAEHGGYDISRNLAMFIIERYGKSKMIQLLKIRREGEKGEIRGKIEKILGKNIDIFLDSFEVAVIE